MNTTSLEYALGKLMDIGGNGEIRLEILRFSRQKSQKTGSEDFALAFRISRGGEETAGRETETATGTAAGAGTERAAGTAAGTPASPAAAAPVRGKILEA